jgi:hypothetical protein
LEIKSSKITEVLPSAINASRAPNETSLTPDGASPFAFLLMRKG